MYELKRVLAATDGSEHAAYAVVTGASLAQRSAASFDIVSVVETPLLLPAIYGTGGDHSEVEDTLLKKGRAAAEAQARGAKVREVSIHVVAGLAAPTITQLADELPADVIVVGAHPRPEVERFLVGSTAERVIMLARCPVLVATVKRRAPFRRVLAAVDLSPHSASVMSTAGAIARVYGADFRILHVNEPLPPMLVAAAQFGVDEMLGVADEAFERLVAEAEGLPDGEQCVRKGCAGGEILKEARDWKADLVVVGSHGFGFLNRIILGSTSTYVLRHGHTATVIVPDESRRGFALHEELTDAA